jgi:membrane protease YdiL (CAAX protease family)
MKNSPQKNTQILRLLIWMLGGLILSLTANYFINKWAIFEGSALYLFAATISQICIFALPSFLFLYREKISTFGSANNTLGLGKLIYPIFFTICCFIWVYGLNELISTAIREFDGLSWAKKMLNQQEALYATLFSDSHSLLIQATIIALLPAIIEELFFRRILFGMFYEKNNRFWPPALTSSLLFALLHFQPVMFPSMFFLALVFCYLYKKSGTIWLGAAFHFLNNLFQLLSIQNQWEYSAISIFTLCVFAIAAISLISLFKNNFQ